LLRGRTKGGMTVSGTLYRGAAIADGRSPSLRVGMSLLVENRQVTWIRPTESEPAIDAGVKVLDARGATVVPGLVDGHSHVTLPGGAHWVERGLDPAARLVEEAEHNGRLLSSAGIRWARDVGSVTGADPVDGRRRALALGVRDRWRNRPDYPYLRSAGTWIAKGDYLPGLALSVRTSDELLAAAKGQLDDGADLVKLMMDAQRATEGPGTDASPWTADEVRRVTDMARARGAAVTAHSTYLPGARAAVAGGVHSIEHGFTLDATIVRDMAARGVFLVSTLAIFRSLATFARTSPGSPIASARAREQLAKRKATALESLSLAHAAGVRIAAGTDSGGGSLRANQLAWEIEALVEAGLAPWEALGAATYRGGELLGEPDAGTLREGGPADFFLVHGDPLTDPSSLWRVWRTSWAP
jgi:imidazolonepropionase-like amidohydrolase